AWRRRSSSPKATSPRRSRFSTRSRPPGRSLRRRSVPRDNGLRGRHFLDLDRIAPAELRRMLDWAAAYKGDRPPGGDAKPLAGKSLAMIFEKPSTRTRVSFELAMKQLGGHAVVLERGSSQLGRGETIADTARVLSRYVDAIMVRTTKEEKLQELAAAATVPVI